MILALPLFLPMSTDILLSLRSFWSCFDFSPSRDLRLSFVSLPVPASLLSPWRFLLELDPLSNEGKPKLSTDDFFCAEPGVVE